MYKIESLLDKVEEDLKKNKVQKSIEDIKNNLILVLGNENELILIQNDNITFNVKCATGINGFGNEPGSKKTPLGLHKVIKYYGDGLSEKAIFKGRKYIGELKDYSSYPNIYPVILTRILQLSGLEKRNSNTKKRYIYVHGTPNIWYWDTNNLRRTYGCILLKPKDMMNLFNKVKPKKTCGIKSLFNKLFSNEKETFVYILRGFNE